MKAGYKKTDVGVIPEDWLTSQLQQIADDDSPICYGIVQIGRSTPNGIPVLAIKNLNLDYFSNIHRASTEVERPYVRSRIRPDDVLVSVKGTTGRIGIVPSHFRGNISRDLARVRPCADVAPHFIYQILQSELAQRRLAIAAVGTTRMELSIAVLKQVCVPLPRTKAEQEAIANVLSDADALIASVTQLIAKKNQIKEGATQVLLAGKKRLPGFETMPGYKMTELGEIPQDWEVMPFVLAVGSYIDYRGRTPRKLGLSWGGGDILALSANNVQMGRIDPDKEAYLGGDLLYRRWMLQGDCEPGDILLTMEAPLGNVAQIPDSKRYILSQRVLLIKPRACLHRDFIAHYMRGRIFQKQLTLNSTGSTARGIQRRRLDDITICLPPTKAEQEAIAGILTDMDAEIAALEVELAKARGVKQGMMQELLTGRIRLV